jgi:1-acyl-sn-glycerol-3-phosphate acyltransferase
MMKEIEWLPVGKQIFSHLMVIGGTIFILKESSKKTRVVLAQVNRCGNDFAVMILP